VLSGLYFGQLHDHDTLRAGLLDNEGVDVGVLAERWLRGNTEVLLFVLASNRILMTEDEVQLRHGIRRQRTCLVTRLEYTPCFPGRSGQDQT